jgi:hypothetical protein
MDGEPHHGGGDVGRDLFMPGDEDRFLGAGGCEDLRPLALEADRPLIE